MGKKTYKNQKISGKKEISRLFKTGKKWAIDSLCIIYEKNCFIQDRFAVILSKKNGNAVKRNKIKRIFREAFRKNKRKNPPFFDFLFKPEPGYDPQNAEVKNELLSWFSDLEKN